MNKNIAGILGAAAVLTMLAGCTAYDRAKDQVSQPVVKDVKKGMSRQQVMQIAGRPSSEVSMVHVVPARPISWVSVTAKLKPTSLHWTKPVTC